MPFLRRATIGNILLCLKTGGTYKQIAERTGVSYTAVQRYIVTWHRMGIVYKERFIRGDCVNWQAVWRLRTDNETDAVKPERLSSAVNSRVYKKRKTAKQMGVWGGLIL
jgi:hypothetical protein